MLKFITWRFGRAVLTVLAVTVAVFLAARLTGNPLEMMYPEGLPPEQEERLLAEFGLDQPIPVQFLNYVRGLCMGNFGISLREKRPVAEMFAEDIGATLKLAGVAFTLSVLCGIPIGMVGALKRRSGTGRLVMSIAFLGYAVPHFIIALSLILVFAFYLHWLPSTGNETVWHYVLPTVTLAAHRFASIARHTRSSLLDVLSQDFMRTARAKGLEERVVIFKHALRNSLIPVVTILGLQITGLINGSIIIETVFAWPGIGRLFVGAVLKRDFPVLQFGVLCFASIVVLVNFLVDICYVVIDPRIRTDK
ncbi:MAG: ABC transporter permease [Desulfobacterales bacterium]|jgi:peptide/nickel transport system permease protein|nr:ABC transporter permease [Desulfobacterales bacterium]